METCQMRLTIARKIALAVTAIVILSIGTMAWVTSSNLQRGFVAYLNELQTQDLDQLRELLEDRYRTEGNWDWLRHKPRALRDVLDQMKPRILAEPDERYPSRRRPPREDDDPQGEGPPPAEDPLRAGPPAAYPPPRVRDDGYGPPPPMREGPPPIRRNPPPARPGLPPPREEGRGRGDPMGFASRLSIQDADAGPLVGPPEFPPGIERDIKVEGKVVGRMRLVPLRQAIGSDASATGFLREQLQSLLLLSSALILLAILAAIWLARHLLRPVDALREVTARIACGEFDARAPLLSRDELAELALHVNAMAEALEESEQQRRKMLADVSHELRTPLTVIRGEIEALLDGIRKADAGALASLHAEVLRLNKLVDDLHQLTLADAGDLQYQWQEVDLSQLLLPVLARYQPRAQQAGLDLSWSLPPSAVSLRKADAGRLTQVLTNLLENSVRYTDSGGQIVVALTQANRTAELTVEDSAPGVPQQAYSAMFDRLYRADAARSRSRGGSGLGLAICKALVEAHGGSITALPSVLGGVKMLIRLPLDRT
jgi:two-component system sensor histidine kinase BaeS